MNADLIRVSDRYSVRATTPEDGPAIVALMAAVGLRPNVESQHLHWRYWQEREDWHGSRSYVLTDGRALLAHAALIPLHHETTGRQLSVAHLIDWAARPGEPGTGVMLLRHLATRSDALIGIGGSEATLRLLPILGFQKCGSVRAYVRTLRPLKLLDDASRLSWKLLPRVARSAAWCLTAPPASGHQWRARQVASDHLRELAPLVARTRGAVPAFARTEAHLRYMLRCPIVPMECFVVEQDDRPRGYFILAFAQPQARLVDAGLDSDAPADWRALIACAVLESKRNTQIAEIATWASDSTLSRCLEESGFHARFALPIQVRSRNKAGFAPTALRVHMVDSDAAYLHEGAGVLWA